MPENQYKKTKQDSIIIGDAPCPECRAKGRDSTGNHLIIFSNGNKYCNRCHYKEIYPNNAEEDQELNEQYNQELKLQNMQEDTKTITEEQKEAVKTLTTTNKDYRGIRAETAKFFGVRYELSEETAEVVKQYYPATKGGELVGYKVRQHPKTFLSPVGYCGKDADFFGQFRFAQGGRDILIVGGEVDQLSAFQMLRDSQIQRGKGDYEPIAVVSSIVGEQGTIAQAKLHYKFLNKFNRIILALDNDEAGKEAQDKLIKALPKGKVYLMQLRYKDPNEYLRAEAEKDFVRDFYDCKQWTPAGLYTSDSLYEAALEYAGMDRLAMPSFMSTLNDMLGGGIPRGYAVVTSAGTSAGKSTFINQILTEWVLNTNEKVGVLSLEATAGEYAMNILSYYLKVKFASISDKKERMSILESPEVKESARKLFVREDGSPRFVLCDDRGDNLDNVEAKMEEMIRSMGITVLVVDVTSDLLAGEDIARQERHMAWQKKIVKETGIILFNVFHTRKTQEGQKDTSRGAEITDNSIMGSSSISRSAGIIIGLVRDKMAEDEIERNTTYIRLLKNRADGRTGAAGELLYLRDRHELVDKQKWLRENAGDF